MNKYKNKTTKEIVLAKQFFEDSIIKLNIDGYYIDAFIPKNGWLVYYKNNNNPQIINDEEFKNMFIPEKMLLFD